MTTPDIQSALIAGVERLAAWSDCLDEINVFPVANNDTGRNLMISLTPLQTSRFAATPDLMAARLQIAARGASGNMASRFFAEIVGASKTTLSAAIRAGSQAARTAVPAPREGTMLTLYDAMADHLMQASFHPQESAVAELMSTLRRVVRTTREQHPRLAAAGVVDAGALAMYLFFDAFFWCLAERPYRCCDPANEFGQSIAFKPDFQTPNGGNTDSDGRMPSGQRLAKALITRHAESRAVANTGDNLVKIDFRARTAAGHPRDVAGERTRASQNDPLGGLIHPFQKSIPRRDIHIVTDAAASLARPCQRRLDLTLLDGYITVGHTTLPETRLDAEEVYARIQAGETITTAQASNYERHQFYHRLLERHARVVYLCTGSAFSSNYAVASAWKKTHDRNNRFTVIDTGATSGRLAAIAADAACRVAQGASLAQVVESVKASLGICQEYLFLDNPRYPAARGRLFRTRVFWDAFLGFRPVIAPRATGFEKAGGFRRRKDQIRFATECLAAMTHQGQMPAVWLQFTDNRTWVEAKAAPAIRKSLPRAELVVQPLSLTTGIHTGPGSWAVACHPAPAAAISTSALKQRRYC